MNKTIKGIKIDCINKTIEFVEVEKGDREWLDSMYKHLDCEIIESVWFIDLPPNNCIWVDEEGWLHKPLGIFAAKILDDQGGHYETISGHGLILGRDDNFENTDTTMTLEEVKAIIQFKNNVDELFSNIG